MPGAEPADPMILVSVMGTVQFGSLESNPVLLSLSPPSFLAFLLLFANNPNRAALTRKHADACGALAASGAAALLPVVRAREGRSHRVLLHRHRQLPLPHRRLSSALPARLFRARVLNKRGCLFPLRTMPHCDSSTICLDQQARMGSSGLRALCPRRELRFAYRS
eukprot:1686570-Rhodomonas_salina.2